jgi:hypothetical protein
MYYHCRQCRMIFADPGSHLDWPAQKRVYDRHENDPGDPRYRQFLSRLATPLLARLTPGMRGLDYGCGPGPTLSVMLRQAGMHVEDYDLIYRPNEELLRRRYDFVTCSETAEHFTDPAGEWQRLVNLLEPGGWLGVMTKLLISPERFMAWHYKNDPTHVSFYGRDSFRWIAGRHGLTLQFIGDDVILLQRPIR